MCAVREERFLPQITEVNYERLKDKLNIVRIRFTSGDNEACASFPSRLTLNRCPRCGIALKSGVCPKCGYRFVDGR